VFVDDHAFAEQEGDRRSDQLLHRVRARHAMASPLIIRSAQRAAANLLSVIRDDAQSAGLRCAGGMADGQDTGGTGFDEHEGWWSRGKCETHASPANATEIFRVSVSKPASIFGVEGNRSLPGRFEKPNSRSVSCWRAVPAMQSHLVVAGFVFSPTRTSASPPAQARPAHCMLSDAAKAFELLSWKILNTAR
jgi:hypothetical protein